MWWFIAGYLLGNSREDDKPVKHEKYYNYSNDTENLIAISIYIAILIIPGVLIYLMTRKWS